MQATLSAILLLAIAAAESAKLGLSDAYVTPTHVSPASREPVQIIPRIIGGSCSKCGVYPWFAEIRSSSPRSDKPGAHLCGGTLVDRYTVLTAAHCFTKHLQRQQPQSTSSMIKDFNEKQPVHRYIEIAIGRCHFSNRSYVARATAVYLHPEYSWSVNSELVYDAAIIKLRSPGIEHVQEFVNFSSVAQDRSGWVDGLYKVIGWGQNFYGLSSPCLKEVTVVLQREETCRRLLARQNVAGFNKTSMVCIGRAGGKGDVCFGDSGGPLLLGHDVNGRKDMIQIGITSFGNPSRCGDRKYPSVFTRISALADWIRQLSGKVLKVEIRLL